MGRTLYLTESGNDICVHRDGPSVWIKTREKAGQRVPGRLLGRVVIMGNVRLDAAAITHWAEMGVPVLFMNSSATETALTIPYNHHLPVHYRRQKILFETPSRTKHFLEWAIIRREIVCNNVAGRLLRAIGGEPVSGIGEGNYQQILVRLIPAGQERWKVVTGVLNNLFRELITEKLIKAGLDPHVGAMNRRRHFGLSIDIEHILGAEADIQAVQFFRSEVAAPLLIKGKEGWTVTAAGMRNIAHRFENRRVVLANMIDKIIDEIFEIMREIRI
jgi:CRISPR/Cas system-associated endonuclease Cas1